ncbi:MAG: hypothetical protein DMG55_06915 [Acidobacteria bacterium]|nr:MAG: hypothetical protein DMG55_06915 [Acidobacteriota bacterium]
MTAFFNSIVYWRRATMTAGYMAILCAALIAGASAGPDESSSDSVGIIDGEAISVTGPMSVEVVHGRVKTVLGSGSDVRVKSGTARIDLVEGGQIGICGLTVALDTGTIHVHIEQDLALTIYTPQIQAQAIAIGDAPRDVLVGFDASSAMCIRANSGAVRAEQQLTGQSVLVPQTGDVLLLNGQLDSLRIGAGHCACNLQAAGSTPPPQPEVSQEVTSEEAHEKGPQPKPNTQPQPATVETPAAGEEPVYQVFIPPLIYDANAKVQPEVDPRMIVLVRHVRVRPALIFQGRVEGQAIAAGAPPPVPAQAVAASASKSAGPAGDSFVDRVRNFVRKLWPSGS